MQPLDKDSLFSIFDQGDEAIYQEHNVQDVLKNPFVLMGMVVNGVHNYRLMDIMYTRHYGNKYKSVQKEVKYKYFNKLYNYLLRIDQKDFLPEYKIGESFNGLDALTCLNEVLFYFEFIEEYEKCARIKMFIDLLKEEITNNVKT